MENKEYLGITETESFNDDDFDNFLDYLEEIDDLDDDDDDYGEDEVPTNTNYNIIDVPYNSMKKNKNNNQGGNNMISFSNKNGNSNIGINSNGINCNISFNDILEGIGTITNTIQKAKYNNMKKKLKNMKNKNK